MEDNIVIRGAKENNLKNINLVIPRNKLVVFTGVSGSGKSTLAFDTIFAEGQRRYIESLSAYAFLAAWTNRIWTISKGSPRRSQSSRNQATVIPVRPLER
jgi:excinuclease UvrABC ATPase subunit